MVWSKLPSNRTFPNWIKIKISMASKFNPLQYLSWVLNPYILPGKQCFLLNNTCLYWCGSINHNRFFNHSLVPVAPLTLAYCFLSLESIKVLDKNWFIRHIKTEYKESHQYTEQNETSQNSEQIPILVAITAVSSCHLLLENCLVTKVNRHMMVPD